MNRIRWGTHALGALACGVAAAVLVACGGGTSQVDPFIAKRVLAMGDESSMLTPTGGKYSVAAVYSDNTLDCTSNPIWVQSVASLYGFVFNECNPNTSSNTQAIMLARLGGKADDLPAQIDAQVGAGGFTNRDLVTLMLGANDVLEMYEAVANGSLTEAAAKAELALRGERLGKQVNRMVDLGARVIVSTIIDLGLSPYAIAKGPDAQAQITRLVAAFNGTMRVTIRNDGRYIGLVLADELVQGAVKLPASYTMFNVTDAACAVALPECTTGTLVDSATAANWLWADATHIAYGAQAKLAEFAVARARNNPF